MTRDEFNRSLMTAPFSNGSLRLHDAAQRQQIARLREALQLLYDVQNGCPLPKYQDDWDRAIELTEQALKEQP